MIDVVYRWGGWCFLLDTNEDYGYHAEIGGLLKELGGTVVVASRW